MRLRHLAWTTFACVLACTTEHPPEEDPRDEDPPPPACAEPLLDTTFLLAPTAEGTQIRPGAVWTGDTLWATWLDAAEDGSGNFHVYATRLGCDGSQLTPPFRVNTSEDGNHGDPVVTAGDGNVYLAWDVSRSVEPSLVIRYRTFRADGTPLMDEDRTLALTDQGLPSALNAWIPSIAALPDHRFAIAGSRGIEAAPAFQAFVQRVDAHGDLLGDTIDGHVSPAATQLNVSIAARGDGTLHLAWPEEPFEGLPRVVQNTVEPAASAAYPQPPFPSMLGRVTNQPRQATSLDGHRNYLVFQTEDEAWTRVHLKDGTTEDPLGPTLLLGTGGRHEHSAVVAAGPGGGAVVFHRHTLGQTNEVRVQRFREGEDGMTLGEPVPLPTVNGALAPYLPTLTHVIDDVWFVGWTERDTEAPASQSLQLRVLGRFIDLSE